MTHGDKCCRYADAVLSFADRVVALDHHEGVAYALTLHDGSEEGRRDALAWLRLATTSLTALAHADAAPAGLMREAGRGTKDGHVLGHALDGNGAARVGMDMASERPANRSDGMHAHEVGQSMVATAAGKECRNEAAASPITRCIGAVATDVEQLNGVEMFTAPPSPVEPHLASPVSHQPQLPSEEEQSVCAGTMRSTGALDSANDFD
jgi:hypothetical protein